MRSRWADAANLDVIAVYGANRWPALPLDAPLLDAPPLVTLLRVRLRYALPAPFASARIAAPAAVGLVEAGVLRAAFSADSSAGAARR